MRPFAASLILLLAACAQVSELSGGEKDMSAPLLLDAEPPNGTVRFAADRIRLRFNERIKLDRVRDRLLISPPLDQAPEVTVNAGEEVVIALRTPLADSTTYTFNLGEAVVDITENNAAAGLTYVVSTGDVLDSAKVHGTLIDAFTSEPVPDMLVTLHADTDTAGFTARRPAYFTRTDKQGAFLLGHLREGAYRLHALQDQNANFRKDLPNERVAFADTLVETTDSTAHVLRMFLPLAATQQVKEAAVLPDRGWRLVLARPADSLALTSIDRTGGSLTWLQEWNATRDTVLFWPSDTALLAGQRFAVLDSSRSIDTMAYRPIAKMPFNVDVRATGRSPEGAQLLLASRPIAQVEASRMRLLADSTEAPAEVIALGHAGNRLFRSDAVGSKEGAKTLLLLPGAFRDIYGGSNDTLRLSLGSGQAAQTGELTVNLTADTGLSMPGPFLLQLLNAQGGVVRTEAFPSLPRKAELGATAAGSYTLKLILDADGDGRWSTGSLENRRQPEGTLRQKGEVNVRAGWEVAVDWVVVSP